MILAAMVSVAACAPSRLYHGSVILNIPTADAASCAEDAMKKQGLNVNRDAAHHLIVFDGKNVVNLTSVDPDFTVSLDSTGKPLSCDAIRNAAPLARRAVAAIQAQCLGGRVAEVTEDWNQEHCGVSLIPG
jgi:hypothetical protein